MNKIDLTINTDLATQILSAFIHRETTRAGFQKVVVGVSGGIDSALSCVLAAKALGPQNVLAVRMPYRTSSPDSLEHAQLLIDQFGVQSLTIPISDMADGLIDKFSDMNNQRKGNIMARCRMIVLYDQSSAFGGLVVGTSNKTEILLGYSTLFGDSASAFNPIGDLYKTQVRQLSTALDIPQVIIQKAPSADLWANQTDEGELGFTYADDVSQTSGNRYGDEYEAKDGGRTYDISPHITIGAKQADSCLSIHWAWDESTGKAVVAHVGRHKTNTSS